MDIQNIINLYSYKMAECRGAKDGGSVRGIKAGFGDEFVSMIALQALEDTNLKGGLSIKSQYSFDIKGINIEDSAKLKSDVVILYKEIPIINIEVKDYADADMYKRFLMDAHLISKNYKGIENILFQFQNASDKNDTSRKVFNSYFDVNIQTFCLTDIRRNSKMELHHAKTEITEEEVSRAINFIKKRLQSKFTNENSTTL
jgi:hypothetical protein